MQLPLQKIEILHSFKNQSKILNHYKIFFFFFSIFQTYLILINNNDVLLCISQKFDFLILLTPNFVKPDIPTKHLRHSIFWYTQYTPHHMEIDFFLIQSFLRITATFHVAIPVTSYRLVLNLL